jgi:uncharacterized membrane protein
MLVAFLILGFGVFIIVPRWSSVDKDKIFLAFIGATSVSLLMFATLVSPATLLGWDIHTEMYVFIQTANGGWNPFGLASVGALATFNSLLSVTVLPTVLSKVTGLDGISIFKFVFPLIYSIMPLVLYNVYRRFLSSQAAFVAVFFFMSYSSFYAELIALARQEIAELFLVLALMLFFSEKIARRRSVRLMLILLTFGIVSSHYSIAFIYVLTLIISFMLPVMWRKTLPLDDWTVVLFASALVATWYVFFVNPGTIIALTTDLSLVGQGFINAFFDVGARPLEIVSSTGGIYHAANRWLQYSIIGILTLGFLALLKRKNTTAEARMLPLMMAGMFLAGSILALPFFAQALDLGRTFHIATIFISPCLWYGFTTLSSALTKAQSFLTHRKMSFVMGPKWRCFVCGILLMYFLFSSGWVFAVTGDAPSSPILDVSRMKNSNDPNMIVSFNSYYTSPQDAEAAAWLRYYRGKSLICTDIISGFEVLFSSGDIPFKDEILVGLHIPPTESCEIFSSVMNTRYGIWASYGGVRSSETLNAFPPSILSNVTSVSRIYSNGGATIYNNSPPS